MGRNHLHPSFLSPIHKTFDPEARKVSWGFYLMSQGGNALHLQYPSIGAAKRSQNVLLKASNTHKVGSFTLFTAIQKALILSMSAETGRPVPTKDNRP